ncbi:MAG: hypothetical protein LQ343_000963 [Gyalolechia ehrenbergii]|nr:MAG: hypothetical protein LQ343_000963 [Gyalolechia ehrenbergii]
MAQQLKNVIILGASGNVGKPTVDALLAADGFNVTVLTRKGSSATFPSEVKVHSVDDTYPSDQLHAAFKGQDAVINLLPPSDVKHANAIADAAAEAGVKRYIPSEFGSDTSNPKVVELVPVFAGKAKITEYLKTKESAGMSWSAVVNGALFDWGLQNGFLGFDLVSHNATILDSGDARVNYTTLSTVGQGIVAILSNPGETANRYIYIQSTKASQNQILAALEKSTGKKWNVNKRSTAEASQTGGEKLGKGDMSGILDLIIGGIYRGEPAANYDETRGLDNDLLGLKQATLEELVDKLVKGQKV